MAPKKNRGSSQQTRATRSSSREPAPPQPPPQKKGGRKRQHSDVSNASESSAHSVAATPSKRRRRGEAQAEHEMLEQVPEMMEDEEEEVTAAGDKAAASIEVSQSSQKHVHFGGQAMDGEDMEYATAMTTTPDPHKLSVKRRLTASPFLNGDGSLVQRSKRISLRRSLPLSQSQDGLEVRETIDEYKFAPVGEVVQEYIERRRGLQLELSELEEQGDVARANTIKAELNNSADALEDEMLVLASHDEYPALPGEDTDIAASSRLSKVETSARFSLSQSQRSQEEIRLTERERFQNAILSLSKEADEAKQKLQILEIEVCGLGFGEEGINALAVLATIRESFTRIREETESVLPETLPDGASNGDLVEIIAANVVEFRNRLRIANHESHQHGSLISDLTAQVTGLLHRLADAELRKQQLEQRWTQLDEESEERTHEISELQQDVEQLEREQASLREELEQKETDIQGLEVEKIEFTTSVDRLTATVQSYREEVDRLTTLIQKMEDEHRASVTAMATEREETVQDLESRLDKQTQLHLEAEKIGQERQAMITGLELQMETLEEEKESLCGELANVTIERDQEQEGRETAEGSLREKTVQVENLDARVDRLDEELARLTAEIEELRQWNGTERTQREIAESELDERNAEFEEITEKLQEQGKQANELRQKLFEVQQLNERKVHELEVAASERDEQFQADIKMEVERREAAEELAQDRHDTIEVLETRIERVEEQMREELTRRDERIRALEVEVQEKDVEMEAVRTDLEAAESRYETQVAQDQQQRDEFEGTIAALQTKIAEREAEMEILQSDMRSNEEHHTSEIDDRNARIAELNHSVSELRNELESLQRKNESLERRVEQAALHMLNLQNEKDDEIEALKSTILDKQAKIDVVEEKAIEVDRSWKAVVEAREEELAALRTTEGEQSQQLVTMSSELLALRRMFEEFIHRTNESMAEQAGDAAARLAKAEQYRAEIDGEGSQILAQMEHMEGFQMVAAMSSTHQTQEVVKQTRNRKRRVKDSGIGMSSDGLDETAIGL